MEKNCEKKSIFYVFENIVMSLYLFVMLGFFPVFFKYQYAKMGDGKYRIFLYTSLVCLPVLFLCLFVRVVANRVKQEKAESTGDAEPMLHFEKKNRWKCLLLDKAVLLYFLCTTVSYLICDFKKDGFFGANGWNMGYLSQLLFVGIYLAVSVAGRHHRIWLTLLMVTSAVVFLVGVLHRFDVDIFNIYGDLELRYKIQFLSTMGQASWYSSFLCTVFPIGLYVFYRTDNKKLRIVTGFYSVIAMCTLVTQNTDSAFLSLGAVIILLLYLSFDGKKEFLRFLSVLMVIFASFTIMGILQRVFEQHMIPLEDLSLFMTQSLFSPVMFLISLIAYLCCKKWFPDSAVCRKWFWILLGLVGVVFLFMVLFIVLNSTGVLYTHFGYQNVNNYLLFTDDWGNRRGFAWRLACEMYAEYPFLQKLIGVGPECFLVYGKSVPEYARQLTDYWGNLSLTNAHNEYLTKLVNLGFAGLASYVFMLGSAVYVFVKHRKDHALLPAFALCVVSYAAHNIFCYEQVCCTPAFYILLGFGNHLCHRVVDKNRT